MLKEKISRFKVGYKISNDIIQSIISPETNKLGAEIHATRTEAYIRSEDLWEDFGYLIGVGKGLIEHPYKTYKILIKKDEVI